MNHDDVPFMDLAIMEARRALEEDKLPVGCVIVESGKVVGTGYKSRDGHVSLDHAEMVALRNAIRPPRMNGRGLTVYTTLEPCAMCFGALAHSRIPRVVYALEDPDGGATATDLRHIKKYESIEQEIVGGVQRKAVLELFRKFFQTTKDPFWKNQHENELFKLCTK